MNMHKDNRIPSFLTVYIGLTFSRYSAILVLEIIYTFQRQQKLRLTNERRNSTEIENNLKTELSYRCLEALGAQYRDGHAVAALLYSTFVFGMISILYITIFGKGTCLFSDCDFYQFLTDQKSYCQNITCQLRSVKELIKSSNQAHFDLLRQTQNQENLESSFNRSCHSFLSNNQSLKTQINDFTNKDNLFELNQIVDELSFWPENRTAGSYKKLKLNWIRFYVYLWVHYYFGAMFILLLGRYILLNRAKTRLKPNDLIGILDEHFMVVVGSEFFVAQITKFIMAEVDQSILRKSIHKQMKLLIKKLEHTQEIYCTSLPDKLLNRQFEDLRVICNRDAMDIYLGFHYFLWSHKKHRTLGNALVTQYSIMMLAVGLASLPVLCQMQQIYLQFFIPGSALVLFLMNVVNMVGASTPPKLIGTLQLVWSLLARAQFLKPDGKNVDPHAREMDLNCGLTFHSNRQTFSNNCKKKFNLAHIDEEEILQIKLLEPYTTLLWLKLVKDSDEFSRKFSYRIMHFYHLNYPNMIRVNFWVLSLAKIAFENLSRFLGN